MSSDNPDPDPRTSSGLNSGGGVPPGETPPGESGTTSATGPRDKPIRGWAKGPMLAIVLITAVFVVFFLAYAVFIAS